MWQNVNSQNVPTHNVMCADKCHFYMCAMYIRTYNTEQHKKRTLLKSSLVLYGVHILLYTCTLTLTLPVCIDVLSQTFWELTFCSIDVLSHEHFGS